MKRILAVCLCLMMLLPALAIAEDTQLRVWHDCDEGIVSVMEARVNETLAGSGVSCLLYTSFATVGRGHGRHTGQHR